MRQSLQRQRPYHETSTARPADVWEPDRFSHTERMAQRPAFAEFRRKWRYEDFDGRAWMAFKVMVSGVLIILGTLAAMALIVAVCAAAGVAV